MEIINCRNTRSDLTGYIAVLQKPNSKTDCKLQTVSNLRKLKRCKTRSKIFQTRGRYLACLGTTRQRKLDQFDCKGKESWKTKCQYQLEDKIYQGSWFYSVQRLKADTYIMPNM